MQYTTIYDISTEPYEGWIWFGLTGLIGMATLYSFGILTKRKPGTYPQRYWFMGFALVVALIAGLSYWDFHRLQNRLIADDCQKLEGIIQGHWEKKWAEKDSKGRYDRKHYEGFTVNGIKFGYYINEAEHAGFQNGGITQIRLYDGLPVRISYLTDKHIDDGSLENRILKFQIRQ